MISGRSLSSRLFRVSLGNSNTGAAEAEGDEGVGYWAQDHESEKLDLGLRAQVRLSSP
jgi:hypothetical protein